MSEPAYRVVLEKDTMVFSAAHFITFNGNVCESLHGHNYRVKCEVVGTLDENGYVCDFIALRDQLASLVNSLDHQMLLPTEHPQIRVNDDGREVTVTFEEKRWVFPSDNCQLLPIANTTAELLAQHLASLLRQLLKDRLSHPLTRIIVSVDENRGQWGVAEIDW